MLRLQNPSQITAFLLHDQPGMLTAAHVFSLLSGELAKFRRAGPLTLVSGSDDATICFSLGENSFLLECGFGPLPVSELLDEVSSLPDPSIFANADVVLNAHSSTTRLTFSLGDATVSAPCAEERARARDLALKLMAHFTAVLAYALPTTTVYWPLSGYVLPTDMFAEFAGHNNSLFLNTRPAVSEVGVSADSQPVHSVDLVGSELFIGQRIRLTSASQSLSDMTIICMQYLADCLEQKKIVGLDRQFTLSADQSFHVTNSDHSGPEMRPSLVLLTDEANTPAHVTEAATALPLRGALADEPEDILPPQEMTKSDTLKSVATNPYSPLSALLKDKDMQENLAIQAYGDDLTAPSAQSDGECETLIEEETWALDAIEEPVEHQPHHTSPAREPITEEAQPQTVSQPEEPLKSFSAGTRVVPKTEQPLKAQRANMAELRAFTQSRVQSEIADASDHGFSPDQIVNKLRQLLPLDKLKRKKAG